MADFVQKTIETLDKPVPQLVTTGIITILGYTIQEWIGFLTCLYLALMCTWYLLKLVPLAISAYRWVRAKLASKAGA